MSYRSSVVWVLMIIYTLNFMDRQVISVLMPQIQQEFTFSDAQGGLLHGTAFALFYVTLALPIARWADVGNRVRIIALATALWSLMTAFCGLARNFTELFLARVGVGVGEAGCSPAAYSIISGYYPPNERAGAMGIYGAGIALGSAIGLGGGGILAEHYHWRDVFLMFGIPGIAAALFVLLYVREPKREPMGVRGGPKITTVLAALISRRSFIHATAATSLLSFGGFAAGLWLPSFLVRTHGMSLGQIGLGLAALATLPVLGTIVAGQLTNKWVRKDRRWHMLVPAIAMLVGVPFSIIALLLPHGAVDVGGTSVPNVVFVLALLIIPGIAGATYVGPVMSALQSMVAEPMRALTTAIFLFVTNLIGLGMGPAVVGWVSDLLKASVGAESLRYSLLIFVAVNVWASFHYWRASVHVVEDLKAGERDAELIAADSQAVAKPA